MDSTSIVAHNDKNLLLARAIVVGLTYYKPKLYEVYKNNISKDDIEDINYRRKKLYKIDFKYDMSHEQIKQIRDERRIIQGVLASILYNICNIEEGSQSTEVIDEFAKKLDVQIIIYDENKNIIYKTSDKLIQIKILYYNKKYLHVSRETLITKVKINKIFKL